jgi:hypothetical protein
MKIRFCLLFIISIYGISFSAKLEYLSSALWTNVKDAQASGNYIYCACVDGLLILDKSKPDMGNPIGRCYVKGWCNRVSVSGNYAYLAGSYDGFPIIDVSDKRYPRIVAIFDSTAFVEAINVSENYAFVGDSARVLRILDINDPSNPILLANYQTGGDIRDIQISEGYAYLAISIKGRSSFYNGGYLEVLDISDYSHPKSIGSYYTKGDARSVLINGTYVYLLDGGYGLQVLDASDHQNLEMIGQCRFPRDPYGGDLAINDSLIFAAAGNSSIQVINISRPSNPVLLDLIDPELRADRISIDGNMAYLAGQDTQLRILDINNLKDSKQIDIMMGLSSIKDVCISGEYAYAINDEYGMMVINKSNPAKLFFVGAYFIGNNCNSITIKGNYAYIPREDIGLQIVDISDPTDPKLAGSYESKGHLEKCIIYGNYAYLIGRYSGIVILDISDSFRPIHLKYVRTTQWIDDICIQDTMAYLASTWAGLQVYNVKAPIDPQYVGSFDTQYAQAIKVDGNCAYIADGVKGMITVDISRPDDIKLVSTLKLSQNAGDYHNLQFSDVALSDKYAFLIKNLLNGEVCMVDISDPANPQIVDEYKGIEFSEKLYIDQNYIYIPDWNSLKVLKIIK